MTVSHKNISFEDERGKIIDILEKEQTEYVTYITIKKGTVRGNHYHKESVQYAYVLNGKIKILTQMGNEKIKEHIVTSGDLVYTPENEKHTFIGLEDSEFMVFTRGPRGGKNFEEDTYRLPLEERLNKEWEKQL